MMFSLPTEHIGINIDQAHDFCSMAEVFHYVREANRWQIALAKSAILSHLSIIDRSLPIALYRYSGGQQEDN